MNSVFISGYVKYIKKYSNTTSFKLSLDRSPKEKGKMLLPVKVFGEIDEEEIKEGNHICIAEGFIDTHEYNGRIITEILCFPRNVFMKAKKNTAGTFPPGYPIPPSDYGDSAFGSTDAFPLPPRDI